MKRLFFSLIVISLVVLSVIVLCRETDIKYPIRTGQKYIPIDGAKIYHICSKPQEPIKLLKPNDIITKFNDVRIYGWQQLLDMRDNIEKDSVDMCFIRGGVEYLIRVAPETFGIVGTDYYNAYREYLDRGIRDSTWDDYVINALKGWREHLERDMAFDEVIEELDKAINLGCNDGIVLYVKAFCENMSDNLEAEDVILLYDNCLAAKNIDTLSPYVKNACYLGLADMYFERGDIDKAKECAEKSISYIMLMKNYSWQAEDYKEYLAKLLPERNVDINDYDLIFEDDYTDPHSGLPERGYKDGKFIRSYESGYYKINAYKNRTYKNFIADLLVTRYRPTIEATNWPPKFGLIFTDMGQCWYVNSWSGLYINGAITFAIKNDKWGEAIHSRHIKREGENIIRIVKDPEFVQYYINGQWVGTIEPARPYGESIIGFQTIGSAVMIDDLKVYEKKIK